MAGQMTPFQQRYQSMRAALEKRMGEFESALPKAGALDAKRFLRVALTTFQVNPQILDCTPASVTVAMLQAAAFGLELDPVLGQAYLVPYGKTCQLIIGYRGYMNLARRSNQVHSINAKLVYEKDEFEYVEGLDRKLYHKPFWGGDPGQIVGAYCITRFRDGDPDIFAMSRLQLDAIKNRSRAKSGPWTTDFGAMCQKTVIRHASKFWPIYIEDLARAAELDDAVDTGRDQVITNLGPGIDLLPPAEEPEAEPEKKSALDKLVEETEKDVTPEKKDGAAQKATEPAPEPVQQEKKAAPKAQGQPKTAPATKAAGAPESPQRRDVARTEQAARHEVPRAHQSRVEAEQQQGGLLSDEENAALDRELAEQEAKQEQVGREPGSDDE